VCAAKGPSFDAPACSSRRRLTRTLSAIALLAGIAAVGPGCGSPANIAQAADALQTTLASMPGVSDAWVYHEESYAQGVIVNIAIDVSNATPDQIANVANRVDATKFGLIANYAQNVEFWVTRDRAVTLQRHSQLDAAQIADDTERIRQIAAGTDGRIDWFRSDDGTVNQLSFDQSHSPGTAILDAVRDAAGGTGLSVLVSPVAASRQTPRMMVNFPIDAAEQTSVFNVVDTIPANVLGLRFDSGGLKALEVVAPNPATAEQDLSKVISATDAVSARPMWLAWDLPTFDGGAPAYGGVVKIGDCSQAPASAIEAVAQRTGDGISTLQSRLQSKLDSCGAPAPLPAQSQSTSAPAPPVTPVIGVVAPERRQAPSETTQLPAPGGAWTPCAININAGGGCYPSTSTVGVTSGGGQSGAPGVTTSPPVPRVLPPPLVEIVLPAAAVDPTGQSTTGSASGSGSTASSGSGSSGPAASHQGSSSASGAGHSGRP